jgi:hypothetical protein
VTSSRSVAAALADDGAGLALPARKKRRNPKLIVPAFFEFDEFDHSRAIPALTPSMFNRIMRLYENQNGIQNTMTEAQQWT